MGGRKRDSIESIQKILDDNSIQIKISGQYINQKSPISCECGICGYAWESTGTALKNWKGSACRYCTKGWIRSLDDLRERLEQQGKNFQVEKTSVKYRYSVLCNVCDYKWESSGATLLINNCARCSKKERGSIDKLNVKLSDKKIQVSGVYINANTKVDCLCLVCKEEWKSTPHNLDKSGCPFCCFKGRIPRDRPANLYYVRIENSSNVYWKIGITTKTNVLSRFYSDPEKIKITLLYSYLFENGEIAYHAEQNILRIYKEFLGSNLKILVDGNTEIFTKDVLQMDHLVDRSVFNGNSTIY